MKKKKYLTYWSNQMQQSYKWIWMYAKTEKKTISFKIWMSLRIYGQKGLLNFLYPIEPYQYNQFHE